MLNLLEVIMQRDLSRCVWLKSDKFFDHLENLYTLHLQATAEWSEYLEVIYHDFLVPNDPSMAESGFSLKPKHKQEYEMNYAIID